MSYEIEILKEQILALERALNEARAVSGLAQIQLPKAAQRTGNYTLENL